MNECFGWWLKNERIGNRTKEKKRQRANEWTVRLEWKHNVNKLNKLKETKVSKKLIQEKKLKKKDNK